MSRDPLWRRALLRRELDHLAATNRGALSRLALGRLLRGAGYPVSLVALHRWSRARQGEAYLWACARMLGREDLPAPEWLITDAGLPEPVST